MFNEFFAADFVVPQSWVWFTALLMMLSLMFLVGRAMISFWSGGTEHVVEGMQKDGELPTKEQWAGLVQSMGEIQTQVAKIEYLEKEQIKFSQKLDNGIKERLDGVMAWQVAQSKKVDEMAKVLNQLVGKVGSAEWDGQERRS